MPARSAASETHLGPHVGFFRAPVKIFYSTSNTIKTLWVPAKAETDFTQPVVSNYILSVSEF